MNRVSLKHSVFLVVIVLLLATPSFAWGHKGHGASFMAAFGMKVDAKEVATIVNHLEKTNTLNQSRFRNIKTAESAKGVLETVAEEDSSLSVDQQNQGFIQRFLDMFFANNRDVGLGLITITPLANGGVTISTPYNYYGFYYAN